MTISNFMKKHYKHFNSAVCVDAASGWVDLLNNNGKMFITLAGAMSTAELGISLAELIREDKVHAICCTGANLEEDIYNLVAHNLYERIPNYRYLTKEDEQDLYDRQFNRVTDTCIPEDEAFRKIEKHLVSLWKKAGDENKSYFPYEYIYTLIKNKMIEKDYQIDPKNSWLVAAAEKNLPIFTPGWEDSTSGNFFVANILEKKVPGHHVVKSGTEQMEKLIYWYLEESKKHPIGFFQIGGGIAGDFPICVVPLIRQDLKKEASLWSYFCQISESITSFGSYSGATPNEKITWGKLSPKTPSFIIESDATIVAPLIFQYVLENHKSNKSSAKKDMEESCCEK